MTRSDLTARVAVTTAAAVGVIALTAGWFVGARAGAGIVAAGALTIANFLWLGRSAARVGAGGGGVVAWSLTAGVRLFALVTAVVAILVSGAAHPAALLAGLVVLPAAVVVEGLRAARTAGGA